MCSPLPTVSIASRNRDWRASRRVSPVSGHPHWPYRAKGPDRALVSRTVEPGGAAEALRCQHRLDRGHGDRSCTSTVIRRSTWPSERVAQPQRAGDDLRDALGEAAAGDRDGPRAGRARCLPRSGTWLGREPPGECDRRPTARPERMARSSWRSSSNLSGGLLAKVDASLLRPEEESLVAVLEAEVKSLRSELRRVAEDYDYTSRKSSGPPTRRSSRRTKSLQSTNEELQALQGRDAVHHEELNTVNQQLGEKVGELVDINDDLANLLSAHRSRHDLPRQ